MTCTTCAHFLPVPNDRMAGSGYGRCDGQPVWLYRSPQAACAFNPPAYLEIKRCC